MAFKKREKNSDSRNHMEKKEKRARFTNGADTDGKIKHLNMRFTEEELALLKKEAKKNGRSMHGHLKWTFLQSISDQL